MVMPANNFDIKKYLTEAKETEPDEKEKAADKEEEKKEEDKKEEVKEAMITEKPKLGSGGRFKELVNKLTQHEGREMDENELNELAYSVLDEYTVNDPAALAASIGRKKYGDEKFQQMAAAGRKKHEDEARQLENASLLKNYIPKTK